MTNASQRLEQGSKRLKRKRHINMCLHQRDDDVEEEEETDYK